MQKKTYYLSVIVFLLISIIFLSNSYIFAQEKEGIHKKIIELLLSKKFSEAESLAEKAYEKYPNEPEVICALACVYRNKALKSSIIMDTSAMGIKEGKSGTYKIKGKEDFERLFKEKTYYDRKLYLKAEKLYYEIIAKDQTYLNAYFNLLNDYSTMAEFDNYFKVIHLFLQNLKNNKDTPHYLLDFAGKLYKQDYLDESIKLYNIILKNYPTFTYAKSDIGAVYINQGKVYEALNIFKEVYSIDPDDIVNLKNYLSTTILVEDFNTAFKLSEFLLLKESSNYFHYYTAGTLAFLIDKKYNYYFNKFIKIRKDKIDSVDKDFWYGSANQLLLLKAKNKEDQIRSLEYLLEQFNSAKYDNLAIIISNIINKIEPTNYSLIIQCSIFNRHSFFDKTVEYLERIKDRKKIDNTIMSNYNLYFNYGRIHFVAKKYDIAKYYFLKNFKENKKDPKVNYLLGKCALFLGQNEEAKKYFNINKSLNDKSQMEYINYSIRELEKI